MSRLKTSSLGLVLTLSLAGAAHALDDLTREFAYCAGRYSAEMEHAWLMHAPDADLREARRSDFISLLDAVALDGDGHAILNHRISAKAAQAALLTRAEFASDRAVRRAAREQAQSHIRFCDRYLLQG